MVMFVCVWVWSLYSPPGVAEGVTITSQSVSTPYPGVTLIKGKTSGPTTDFYAALISLCHDHVYVDASPDHTQQTSGAFASGLGAQVAVNGDFYAWTSGTLHVYGDAVGGGQRWPSIRTGRDEAYSGSWFYERYGWIAFGTDFVEYSNTKWIKERWEEYGADQGWSPKTVTKSIPDGTLALISGFPQIVVEGNPIECSSPTASSCFPDRSDMRNRHPRTAMGLTRDRNTFILLVVDGRRSTSVGMYGTELADLMHQLGAHTAFNLDGGGSSQMWVQGQGYVNTPSDGSPRSVPNSWAIFAGSAGGMDRLPGSCDRVYDELMYQVHVREPGVHTDVNGNGLADVCARGPEGMECFLADGTGGFDVRVEGPALSDASGWGDPSNHSTIRMGDVTGNGLADICARANARMYCWLNDGEGFSQRIDGPEWSNEAGFDDIRYFSTIRLVDVTGDGRADLCARTSEDFRCYPSTGEGFGEAIIGPALSDDSGWGVSWHYGTIRMADVTGDGRADVCARRNAGFACWPSEGDGFGDRIDGPEWSNAEGWTDVKYWSTIELVDLDGDGRADVCARSSEGVSCHLSTGQGFGPEIQGPPLTDGAGWGNYAHYSTIRFADIAGDGTKALCARSVHGMRCWPFSDGGFGDSIEGGCADETGWFRERFFRTIRFADVTGDGREDLCARASAGFLCWPSLGDGFADEPLWGPEWSDAEGWTDPGYYTTIRLGTPPVSDDDDEPDPVDPEDRDGGVYGPDGGVVDGDGSVERSKTSSGCGCRFGDDRGENILFVIFLLGLGVIFLLNRRICKA